MWSEGRRFGSVIFLAIPIPSHHLPEAGPVARVLDSPVDHVRVFGTIKGLIGAGLQVCFLFSRLSASAARFSSQLRREVRLSVK